jgi:hypothetical protein
VPKLYHGGVGGLWVGDAIEPNMGERRYVDGCPQCAAHAAGIHIHGYDPPTPEDWVYATTDREYARYYASRAIRGSLYVVRLEEDVEPSVEDPFPTWRGRRAIVLRVPEIRITLTMKQRRKLFMRWGGTAEEFNEMIRGLRSGTSPAASPASR